jgi:hypothetical protein
MQVELVGLVKRRSLAMCERQELVKLGERIAEDGVHRHERALQGLASAISPYSPGAAAVLGDPAAPVVLRERAFAVAVDVVLRSALWSQEAAESEQAAQTDRELQRLLVDWEGQLVGWGA